tara:strand:- start:5413 stop:6372 length:960 start_codon:yes stop_codon:yes gene_type:complete
MTTSLFTFNFNYMQFKERYSTLRISIKFLAIIILTDIVLGSVAKALFFNQKTGKYARSTYAIEETNAELLILGSSHAIRQYIPEIFEENLNKTCYNAGAEGQQLIYQYALERMILKRYQPQIMLLNIDENWLYTSENAYNRLNDLYPYYSKEKDVLRSIFIKKAPWIDFQMLSKTYQLNSTLVHIARYYMSPQKDYNGYRPLYGAMKPVEKEANNNTFPSEINHDFVSVLKAIIEDAKENNVQLIFSSSPNPVPINFLQNKSMQKIIAIAKEENIPYLNYYNSPLFTEKWEFFHDIDHLNDKGATLFTKLLSNDLKAFQ